MKPPTVTDQGLGVNPAVRFVVTFEWQERFTVEGKGPTAEAAEKDARQTLSRALFLESQRDS